MWEDPIVAEVRNTREQYAAQFNYDLRAMYDALKKQENKDTRQKVTFPPKPASLTRKAKELVGNSGKQ
jgi:hypothetical protein